MLTPVPISLKDTNAFVSAHHRHHKPVTGHKFSIGCAQDVRLMGVAIVGRPVSRYLDDGLTLEVNRLCTTGEKNACSMLYAAAARAAKAMGYHKIITYTLDTIRGPHANPAKRFAWGEEEQRNERALAAGRSEGYGACDDEGTSLRAAGWTCMGRAEGKRWTGKRCPAVDLCPPQMKLRYEKLL